MRIHGKKFALFKGAVVIGLSTSCSLDSTADTIEVAGNGRGKAFMLGRYSWTMTVDSLLGDNKSMIDELMDAHKNGTVLSMVMGECEEVGDGVVIPDLSGVTFSGNVIVTNVRVNAPVNGYVSCSVSMQGTGELS